MALLPAVTALGRESFAGSQFARRTAAPQRFGVKRFAEVFGPVDLAKIRGDHRAFLFLIWNFEFPIFVQLLTSAFVLPLSSKLYVLS